MRVMKMVQRVGVVAMFTLFALLAACVGDAEPESSAVQQEPKVSERSSESSLGTSSLTPPRGESWYEGPRPSPNCFWTCLNGAHGETTTVGDINCQRACERACGHTCLSR